MDEMLTWGRRLFASGAFNVLLGAELAEFSEHAAEVKIPIRPELMQQTGFVHGGVLSYAVDIALAYAGGGALRSETVTVEFKINFLRPAKGEFIVARAMVIHAGKNQAVCRCDVHSFKDGSESLCATAQGTVARLGQPPEVRK